MSSDLKGIVGAKPPPSAGAVDLGALKSPTNEQINQMKHNLLMQAGLACPCGKRIRENGVSLHSLYVGPVPTEQGMQPGMQITTDSFCGSACPALLGFLATDKGQGAPTPFAVRELPSVQWFDDEDPIQVVEGEAA